MAMTDAKFRPALLVIDMQEDFCPPNGSLAVPGGRSIAPLINELLSLPSSTLPLKIATKDWHPPNHISFASNHPPPHNRPFVDTVTITNPNPNPNPPPPSSTPPSSSSSSSSSSTPSPSPQKATHAAITTYTTRLWPAHCIQSTPGSSLIPELRTSRLTHTIHKGTDPSVEMYSAFRDPFGGNDSGLASLLSRSRSGQDQGQGEGEGRVTDLYVVGLAADYCVRATAEDAVRWGVVPPGRVYVIEEGTRPVDAGGWEGVKREMEGVGVKVVRWEGEEVRRLFGGVAGKGVEG
ncbi:hypothetical protein VTK26DRAFT_7209 [Humicola hyalothermophila]